MLLQGVQQERHLTHGSAAALTFHLAALAAASARLVARFRLVGGNQAVQQRRGPRSRAADSTVLVSRRQLPSDPVPWPRAGRAPSNLCRRRRVRGMKGAEPVVETMRVAMTQVSVKALWW